MSQLTHINAAGEAHMVDVSAKAETVREARAEAFVTMRSETLAMIIDGSHHKGDVFATARIAGIYDMCKAVQKDMVIGPVRLLAKSGGKSGDFKVDTHD